LSLYGYECPDMFPARMVRLACVSVCFLFGICYSLNPASRIHPIGKP
jgi:hypothetical protein